MDRKQVVLSAEETLRQRDFERKLADIHRQRSRAPLALVDTFGCQQNVADSQHIMGMLQAMGCEFTDEADRADIIVLNTCAIRDHAEKRVFGNLGALTHTKKKNPEQIICLCGCMAQRPEIAEKVRTSYRHVDLVFGPQAMWKFPELLYRVYTRRGRVFSVEEEHGTIAEGMPVVREGRTRAWVSIMYGCNNFCSYCIVPYVRGRERSREPQSVLEECKRLVDQGVQEITLLGQNVNSYRGGGSEFAELLRRVDALGVPRLRFMTSHPKDLSDELIAAYGELEHLMPNLHLPVQAGNNAILQAMNRRYTRERYLELVNKLRSVKPEIGLTTDIIVGFPGETEEQFEDTLSLVRAVRYDSAFTFIYSKRAGTKAAQMPDNTPEPVKSERIQRLIALQSDISREILTAQVGRRETVLVESLSARDEGWVGGKTPRGHMVNFPGQPDLIGQLVRVEILSAGRNTLRGKMITEV